MQKCVPDGQVAPRWLIAARLALLPIDTIKLLVMDQYHDIWTDTWKINGVRMSGRMIEVMTARIGSDKIYKFSKEKDVVIVTEVSPEDLLLSIEVEARRRGMINADEFKCLLHETVNTAAASARLSIESMRNTGK